MQTLALRVHHKYKIHMSCSLNSFKGSILGCNMGDIRSLDYI